jgi:hypothetical protein
MVVGARRTWYFTLGGAAAGAAAAFWQELATAAGILGGGVLFLAFERALVWKAGQKLLTTGFYLDKYWSDAEKDALKRYAYYWQHPGPSVRLSRIAACVMGLGLGAALVLLFHANWVAGAVCLLPTAFCARQAQILDPISTLATRVDKNDFSVSEEWGAVLEIRRQL